MKHINEAATDIVFHFTSLESLISIIKSNRFELDAGEENNINQKRINKHFFMSLTRNRNDKTGYAVKFSENPTYSNGYCRIQLNGQLLNQNNKLKI